MNKIKAVFNWSGGKDSAHALYRVLQTGKYDIVALLTTINRDTKESTMHHIPYNLLLAQAESIGIPLYSVNLTPKGNMEDYAASMAQAVLHFKEQGVTHFIFGDICLYDVRAYREQQLAPYGITVVEPLWGMETDEVMQAFLETGLRSVIVTTTEELGKDFIAREIDQNFVDSLPLGTDRNGEQGEYHSFCFEGPIFKFPIPFSLGKPESRSFDIKYEDGSIKTHSYWFAELKVSDSL